MIAQVVSHVRKNKTVSETWLCSVLEQYARTLRLSSATELAVVLIGDARMRTLHGSYSGEHTVTDVLSFPSHEAYGVARWPRIPQQSVQLGEIFLCVPQIRRQAIRNRVPMKTEFATMLAHGLLHLLGHDHKDPKDAQKMYALQEKLVYTTVDS